MHVNASIIQRAPTAAHYDYEKTPRIVEPTIIAARVELLQWMH